MIFSSYIAGLSKLAFLPHFQNHILVLPNDSNIGINKMFYKINLKLFDCLFFFFKPIGVQCEIKSLLSQFSLKGLIPLVFLIKASSMKTLSFYLLRILNFQPQACVTTTEAICKPLVLQDFLLLERASWQYRLSALCLFLLMKFQAEFEPGTWRVFSGSQWLALQPET